MIYIHPTKSRKYLTNIVIYPFLILQTFLLHRNLGVKYAIYWANQSR